MKKRRKTAHAMPPAPASPPIEGAKAVLKKWGPLVAGGIGIMVGIVSAWSSWISAVAAERAALAAERDSALAESSLQATEPIRLSLSIGPQGTVGIRNLAHMELGQVQVEAQVLIYSHACNAVAGAMGAPLTAFESIPQRSEKSFQLKVLHWPGDGGQPELEYEQTRSMFGCGAGVDESEKNVDGLITLSDDRVARDGVIPACSSASPCSLITYVAARAKHPKLFQWAGPFDAIAVHSTDGQFRSSWSYGYAETSDGGSFLFKEEADRKMFGRVAQYLRRHHEWWGQFDDRDRRAFPERAFGGVGLFRAVSEEEPRR